LNYERAAIERRPSHAPIGSFDALVAFLGEHTYALNAPPGVQYSCSNEGYNQLGVTAMGSARPPTRKFGTSAF
jgi:hypothetical protein